MYRVLICSLAASALFACVALSACTSCERADYREGCHAYCLADDTGLPPSRVRCLDEDAFYCGEPSCADGTAITTGICTDDGPRCADGSEPLCAPAADGG